MSATEGPTILVAEDNDRLRRWYHAALTQKGYRVHTAVEGQEAFRLFTCRGGYHLVIMDINMPNWDGVDAIRTMNLISPESRIIVVSGVLDQDRFQNENPELKILGAYQKPIALETLYRIVEQAMKEKKDEP